MSTLWIREFAVLPHLPGAKPGVSTRDGSGTPIPNEPGLDQSPLTFAASAPSASFASDTRYIIVIADAAFHYVVGDAPVATVSALKVPAETHLSIAVPPGQKIAAINAV